LYVKIWFANTVFGICSEITLSGGVRFAGMVIAGIGNVGHESAEERLLGVTV
jgi:hypothetical protein